jgi:hypothetical protein
MALHRFSPGRRALLRFSVGAVAVLLPCAGLAGDPDLTGWWYIEDDVQTSERSSFVGLSLGFRMHFEQEGAWIFGRGEKTCEDGSPLPRRRQTPIALAGTANGSSVTVHLIEDGSRRRSGGSFEWTMSPDGGRMIGTFTTTAGRSHGRSEGVRTSAAPPACPASTR